MTTTTTTITAAPRRPARLGARRGWTFAYLAPPVGLLAVFVLLPVALTIWLSFRDWSSQTPFGSSTAAGLDNYRALFDDGPVGRDFRNAFRNTVVYAASSIILIVPLSLGFGLLIHRVAVRGSGVLRGILFSTYMVPMIAVALVWSKLYSPTEGPLNQVLEWAGLDPQPWLSSPDTALRSLVILNVWQQVGYFTVLMVAGLTQIPDVVYEAAAIDGATGLRLLWRVTLPLLRRTMLFVVVIALINAVQVFEPVAAITQGGPAGSTNTLTYHIRRVGIERTQGGLGSAMAVMLLLALVVAVGLVFALLRRDVETMNSRYWKRTFAGALVIACCVVAAFPLVWMVLTSLKTPQETIQSPPVWFPADPSLDAYREVTDVIDVPRSMRNSVVIAGVTTLGILATSLMAGYAFAKYRFRGRNALFAVLIATMFLPPIVTLIPLYRIVTQLGFDGRLIGVIAPNLVNAFGIFLMRQFIQGVPDELIDAARIDGAGEARILVRIVAPLVTPALAALALFAFVYYWNAYLWPLTVLSGREAEYPIVLSLGRLLSYTRSAENTNLVMAGAALAVLPPLVVFAFLQRYFVRTIARSGLTG